MIDRAEVESLLACMEQIHKPNHGVIAELCRVYLAWLDAPIVTLSRADVDAWSLPDTASGKRVRLVTDAEAK